MVKDSFEFLGLSLHLTGFYGFIAPGGQWKLDAKIQKKRVHCNTNK